MSAFKHFDTSPYLEGSKLEPKARDPAKVAKVAKVAPEDGPAVAGFAGFAGVQTESSSLEGSAGDQPGSPAAATFPDPFNTETQPKAAASRSAPSKEWAAAAAQLQRMDRPATVSEDRWSQVLADTARLLDWVPILEAMEWTTEDVFGRDDLDRKSLAWLVCGQRIGPVTSVAVTLRGPDGSTSHVYRRTEK